MRLTMGIRKGIKIQGGEKNKEEVLDRKIKIDGG